ncbi:MAG: hypothetical protein D6737_07970 [Chloroflexi bacterium]|nr:MAG: hypothetical protein D6737_07970 [Chloroflexota bacterium]
MQYWLAILLLLIAAGLRLAVLTTLPPGLSDPEVTDIRIAETMREGRVEVFYDLNGQGREGLYHAILATVTSIIGQGTVGFRLVSVWLGVLTVALSYALVVRLLGGLAALSTMALLSVGFVSVLLSRTISPEQILPLLAIGIVFSFAQAFPVYRRFHRIHNAPGTVSFTVMGLLLGIGFYVHPAAFLLALAGMIFILYMIVTRQPMALRTISYANFAILVFIISVTPYIISSIRLPELGGARRVFGDYSMRPAAVGQTIIDSLSGIFISGDASPLRNLPGRPLFDPLTALIIGVGILFALRRWRRPRYALPLIMLLTLLPGAFLRTDAPNFHAFAPILPLLALFFGVGISMLFELARHKPLLRRGLAAGLIVLVGFNLLSTSRDLFFRWAERDDVQVAYNGRLGKLAHYIDTTADDLPTVVCDSHLMLGERTTSFELTATELMGLMMNRKDAELRYVDCGTGLILANGGALHQIIFPEEDTLSAVQPVLQERWLRSGFERRDMPPDSVVLLDVAQEVADIAGNSPPSGYAPEAPGGVGTALFPVPFGGNITLLGYEADPVDHYKPGDVVTSITYWRVQGEVPPDLRLFTHVLADPASIAAQNDTISVLPGQLHQDDIFVQVTFIDLPFETPDGIYDLSIGAYQDTSDTRLEIFDDDHEPTDEMHPRGTRLFLNQIEVLQEPAG